jgi:hypothetical protein
MGHPLARQSRTSRLLIRARGTLDNRPLNAKTSQDCSWGFPLHPGVRRTNWKSIMTDRDGITFSADRNSESSIHSFVARGIATRAPSSAPPDCLRFALTTYLRAHRRLRAARPRLVLASPSTWTPIRCPSSMNFFRRNSVGTCVWRLLPPVILQ